MSQTISKTTRFSVIPCANCGVEFGLTVDYINSKQENGNTFWCPNGHSLSYDSELERLRRERNEAVAAKNRAQVARQAAWDQAQAANRSAAAYKGQTTRLKNRAKNGVCAFCNRSFTNVADHVLNKHPNE